MLNFRDIKEYPLRLLIKYNNNKNNKSYTEDEYLVYDFFAMKTFVINEEQYKKFVANDKIRMIGNEFDIIDNYKIENRTVLAIHSNTMVGAKVVWTAFSMYTIEIEIIPRDKMRRFEFDRLSLDFSQSFSGYSAAKLLSVEGITYTDDGTCLIEGLNRKSVAVAEGVNCVYLVGDLKINELILPESCKYISTSGKTTAGCRIGVLMLGGTMSLKFYKSMITQLRVNSNLKTIYESAENYIGMIVGELSLDYWNERGLMSGTICSMLNLSKSALNGSIKLWDLACNKVILPEGIDKIDLYRSGMTIIDCRGYLEELKMINGKVDEGETFEVYIRKGASESVKEAFGGYLIGKGLRHD